MIIAFASTANGVTKDQVVEHLGRPSSSTLEKLVEAGIVVADHGRYRCVQENIFPCDNASIKAQIAHALCSSATNTSAKNGSTATSSSGAMRNGKVHRVGSPRQYRAATGLNFDDEARIA